jgi:uncharacterized protein (DUF3084 family)
MDIRSDHSDINAEDRDIRQDRNAVGEDRQQLGQTDRQWMQDNRAYQHDLATGNTAGARSELKSMQGDHAAINEDMHNLNAQERDIGNDKAQVRDDRQALGHEKWAREVRHNNLEERR